jgi:hypothetical protein
MNDKKTFPQDDDLADALTELLDLGLIPDSLMDAETAIRNANIDIEALKKRSTAILRDVLAEFPDDWRNISTDDMEAASTELEKKPLKLHLNEAEIKERIQNLISRIVERNKSQVPIPGLAWRNLNKQSKEDLARMLRKFELIADEMGIEEKDED